MQQLWHLWIKISSTCINHYLCIFSLKFMQICALRIYSILAKRCKFRANQVKNEQNNELHYDKHLKTNIVHVSSEIFTVEQLI